MSWPVAAIVLGAFGLAGWLAYLRQGAGLEKRLTAKHEGLTTELARLGDALTHLKNSIPRSR
jgi:hypothetical protein